MTYNVFTNGQLTVNEDNMRKLAMLMANCITFDGDSVNDGDIEYMYAMMFYDEGLLDEETGESLVCFDTTDITIMLNGIRIYPLCDLNIPDTSLIARAMAVLARINTAIKVQDEGYVTKEELADILSQLTGFVHGKRKTRKEMVAELEGIIHAHSKDVFDNGTDEEKTEFVEQGMEALQAAGIGGDTEYGVDKMPEETDIEYDSNNEEEKEMNEIGNIIAMAELTQEEIRERYVDVKEKIDAVNASMELMKKYKYNPLIMDKICAVLQKINGISYSWVGAAAALDETYERLNEEAMHLDIKYWAIVDEAKAPEEVITPVLYADWNEKNALAVLRLVLKSADENDWKKDYISKYMLESHVRFVLFGRQSKFKDCDMWIENSFTDDEQRRVDNFIEKFVERYLPKMHGQKGYVITSEVISIHNKGRRLVYRYRSNSGRLQDYVVDYANKAMVYNGKSIPLTKEVYQKLDDTCELFKVI